LKAQRADDFQFCQESRRRMFDFERNSFNAMRLRQSSRNFTALQFLDAHFSARKISHESNATFSANWVWHLLIERA
jgi:hypothetical protein